MQNNYQRVKNSRERLKQRLLYVMGEKCSICGYDKCSQALEFHHINPENKSFNIGQNTNLATEKALNEARKCILLCANCHREVESGLYTEELKSSFNEEKAKEVLESLKQTKEGQARTNLFCVDCGKPITIYSTTGKCSDCANKSRRLTTRPSREELKQLIRTKPFTQIAQQFGVSDNAIRKWCACDNLPTKKGEINKYSDKEWETL